MQLRPRTLLRLGVTALFALAATVVQPSAARAEVDNFGLGDGHHGPKTVVGNETINSYASIMSDVAPGATTIEISSVIGNPDGFAPGDLILVWRATGVAASEAPVGNQSKRLNLATALATTSGPTNEAGLVGTYEFARIANVSGSTLTLTKPLVRGFTKLVSQVVKVPEYTTVTIPAGASIQATAWQEIGGNPAKPDPTKPWAGGIAIFLATGAITNNGLIHANARGFHGGIPEPRLLNAVGLLCSNTVLTGDPTQLLNPYSPKGQGVVHSAYTAKSGGKGNVSMAGGGGNCVEAGGGGGANRGNGGNGSGTILNLGAGGLGGVGIDYDVATHLTMGGGGGAGRHIVGLFSQVSFGGFGGGVVYIRGQSLTGNGSIQANGGHGENSGIIGLPTGIASEGSGGGGAGGTVVVRLAGELDCDVIGSAGGDGGNAQVLGLDVFGAGGGGGGGRVLFQAASKTDKCKIVVAPGNAGNDSSNGAQNGGAGETYNPPSGGFCLPNATPGTPGACMNPTPVCVPGTGECGKCDGPFGGGTPRACPPTSTGAAPTSTAPVCLPDGSCTACNGDFGSGAVQACQLAAAPHCFSDGSCGKCTSNADCATGTHGGPICNVETGSCGVECTKDEDCKPTEWCSPRSADAKLVCTPKTPNGQPLPGHSPIDGECTPPNGQRVCLSGKCEEDDDLCGLKNGSPCGAAGDCRSDICHPNDGRCGLPNGEPCTTDEQCRSEICVDGVCGQPNGGPCTSNEQCRSEICKDGRCGLPNGEPCTTNEQCQSEICKDGQCGLPDGEPCTSNEQCQSEQCKDGVCTSTCDGDEDCKLGEVCDGTTNTCVPGCRPGGGSADAGEGGKCPSGQECVPVDGSDIGQCQPDGDGGFGGYGVDGGFGGPGNFSDLSGIVEGGGCACNTTVSSAASPFAVMGAACGALLLVRRRQRRARESMQRES